MKKPLFPASDPATRSFNGLHPKSKFLTITLKLKRQVTSVALLPSLLFILTLLLALSPVGWAATVNVNTVAQLVNAVNNGAEGDVINIAAGTYELPASLTPRTGMTIKGAGITNTILKPASSWNPGPVISPYDPVNFNAVNASAYMFNLGGRFGDGLPGGNDNIIISDMTMNGMKQLQGALWGYEANYLTVFNVYFHDYTFCGTRVFGATNMVIRDCEFINMANPGMDPQSGGVVFAYVSNSEIYNNQFYYATKGVYYGSGVNAGNYYGIKGRMLRQSRIHHNTIMINFPIELPFEDDQDVEIDSNYLLGWISIPKGGGGSVPASGVTFNIHHNYNSSGTILEFPRNGVELHHNLLDNDRFEAGTVISGWSDSLATGSTKIHNNLFKNLGRAIADIGKCNNFQFYNNHVLAPPNAGATTNWLFITATGASDFDRSTFLIRDNIFDCTGHSRELIWSGLGAGFSIQNNTLINVTGQANYSNPNTGATRGPIEPLNFTCGVNNEYTVNQWTVSKSANVLREPENPVNTINGLAHNYYTGTWSQLPNFSSLTPANTGTCANFTLSAYGSRAADNFGYTYKGYINVPSGGTYTFYTTSDDGSKLFIGNSQVVNNDGLHGMVEAAGTIGLKAGKHAIEVRFFENGAGEGLEVRYQGPGISKQLIPDSALYRVNGSSLREPENPINTTNGLVHNYYTGTWSLLPDFTSLTPANTGTCANFTLSAYGSRAVDNFGYTYTGYVDVPSDGTYTFYTTSDDGSKLFIGTTQVVNNDGLHAMVEASGTIGLKAGKHAIEVRFFENSGGENMEVRYEGPGLSKQFIPGTSLYRVSGGGTAPSAPSAPSGLSATAASNSQINLNWTDNANNEDNFRIERKTGAGGTWAEIATVGAGVTTYSNTGLSASTQFYYRLRSYNTTGYSAYSSETNATTQSSGQTSYGGAVRTIPGTIEAEDFDSGGQGVAYHDTDAANTGGQYRTSESVDIETTSDVGGGSSVGWTMNGEWLEYTVNVTGGTYNLTFRVATPNTGGQLRVLLDGLDVGSVTIPNTGGWQTWTNVELTGKTLASGNGKVLRLEFPIGNFNLNKMIVEAVGVPSPWLSADIGSVGVAGNTSYDGGTAAFNINGSGADIWDTADAFRYVYHSGSGDCDIKCKVTAVQNTDPWAKAGVMIRETLDANSKNVAMVMTPGNGANFQYRPNTGGISYYTVSPGKTVPYWVRVNRTGNVFKGYISTDGVSWTQVGVDQNITMATGVYIGMAVTSHNNTVTCTSTESSVTAAP